MKWLALMVASVLVFAGPANGDFFWDPSDANAVDATWENPLNWLGDVLPDTSMNTVINQDALRNPVTITSDVGSTLGLFITGNGAILDVETGGKLDVLNDINVGAQLINQDGFMNLIGGEVTGGANLNIGNALAGGFLNIVDGSMEVTGFLRMGDTLGPQSNVIISGGSLKVGDLSIDTSNLFPILDIRDQGTFIIENSGNNLTELNFWINSSNIRSDGAIGAGLFDIDTTSMPGQIVVTVADSTSIEGDLDGDGFVGINDLNLVLGFWNQTVPPADPAADPSEDGFIGIDDLNTVLGNWNAGTPPSSVAVPEPTTLGLLAGAGLGLLRRR